MEIKISEVGGIGEYTEQQKEENKVYLVGEKAFAVVSENTVEVRTDRNLAKLLEEKYESVMKSRYFGSRGVEIVMSGQIEKEEIYDLIRLSYNLSK